MNLDKASASTSLEPLAPPEWTMEVRRQDNQFIAVVARSTEVMCRVSVVQPDQADEAIARAALASKARRWIHDYLQRHAAPNPDAVEGPSGRHIP